MIYDCFSFLNEFDVLDIRLNILNDYVDFFVISESEETFFGKRKPRYFIENKERFGKWLNKIIYIDADLYKQNSKILDAAMLSPNTGLKEHWWVREFCQKESLSSIPNCGFSDTVFVSDVDEIWNPKSCIFDYDKNSVYKPVQDNYFGYLNVRSSRNDLFTGTRFSSYSTLLKYGPNHFRTEREVKSISVLNGGWHFSWLSGNYNKFESDGHPDNSNRYSIAKSSGLYIDESSLPSYIFNNKQKFNKYFSQ